MHGGEPVCPPNSCGRRAHSFTPAEHDPATTKPRRRKNRAPGRRKAKKAARYRASMSMISRVGFFALNTLNGRRSPSMPATYCVVPSNVPNPRTSEIADVPFGFTGPFG